jgi:hypothetical protein
MRWRICGPRNWQTPLRCWLDISVESITSRMLMSPNNPPAPPVDRVGGAREGEQAMTTTRLTPESLATIRREAAPRSVSVRILLAHLDAVTAERDLYDQRLAAVVLEAFERSLADVQTGTRREAGLLSMSAGYLERVREFIPPLASPSPAGEAGPPR